MDSRIEILDKRNINSLNSEMQRYGFTFTSKCCKATENWLPEHISWTGWFVQKLQIASSVELGGIFVPRPKLLNAQELLIDSARTFETDCIVLWTSETSGHD